MVHLIFVVHLVIIFMHMSDFVAARFCEGGHICSLPRECCTQGCCGPRQLPAPSEHVLNLFFISHWYFWCVVVALILAILCAYSLWRKRRTLCGWGLPEHHAQSEGDSAGSCYAPPQYSRCSSFHHPPPPYTEVTSKPDLYPLVFTCNTDNGKNGSSYLMVQYFRNYIVRPAGCSLSAASTMDSLSSSFICNVNEANTLVPPPYSRAASPDPSLNSHFQQHIMPRSASQLVCYSGSAIEGGAAVVVGDIGSQRHRLHCNYNETNFEDCQPPPVRSSTALAVTQAVPQQHSPLQRYSADATHYDARGGAFVQYQQHQQQQSRYTANSSSSISDIFVNATCAAGAIGGPGATELSVKVATKSESGNNVALGAGRSATMMLARHSSNSPPIIYCARPAQHSPRPVAFSETARSRSENPVYNACNGSITAAADDLGGNAAGIDLHTLRRSLETCCQMLHQQHQQQQKQPRLAASVGAGYITSGTCSGVSSLANICTPSSPPQATSPTTTTDEVKEILDQISQLQQGVSCDDIAFSVRPQSATHFSSTNAHLPNEQSTGTSVTQRTSNVTSKPIAREGPEHVAQRPSTLHSKRKYYATASKPSKALYIPMRNTQLSPPTNRSIIKSPIGANFFFTCRSGSGNRLRKGWITRSAPTTPGTNMPVSSSYLDDDSPLLNEDESEQNAEYE